MTVTTTLTDTLEAIHIVGEHILAAARYRASGHIGLAVVEGGIATPPFGPDNTVVGIIDGELTLRTESGETRSALTTLRAAGEFVGIKPGGLAEVYRPATPCDLDEPLRVDATALAELMHWYGTCAQALELFATEVAAEEPSASTLWPEHFDVAIRVGEVNYGALGGDAKITEPYAYVGPPAKTVPPMPSAFWNQPFGAARTRHELPDVSDVVAFYREGHHYI
jgi:hypothetical protein